MADFSHIKGVIWDLDGTLATYFAHAVTNPHFQRANLLAIRQIASEMGIACAYSDQEIEIINTESYRVNGASYETLSRELGLDLLHVHRRVHYHLDLQAVMDKTPGLKDAFGKLNGRLRHSVLTHSPAEWAERALYMQEIDTHITPDLIIDLEAMGFDGRKHLSRRGFEMALERMGLTAEEVLLADDLVKNHVIAAQMGMTTAHISATPSGEPYVHHTYPNATALVLDLARG